MVKLKLCNARYYIVFHPKIVLLDIDNAIDPELVSLLIDG
jgi:hypothetical protein